MKYRIYVIEDDENIRNLICVALENFGYCASGFETAEEALDSLSELLRRGREAQREYPAMFVFDWMLPGMDGMEVLERLRQTDAETKVLILSARSQVADKVAGLDAGANDYLEKPFHLQELAARVRSLTRRQFIQQSTALVCGGISFDTRTREALVNGKQIRLTRKEKGILEYLLLHQGRPISQEELMEHVWDGSVDAFSNSIRVHISALRKKLKAELNYDPITNKVGEGYRIGGERK